MPKRNGPVYLSDGEIVGHIQSDEVLPNTYYVNQYESIRKATIWDYVKYLFTGKVKP